jgi:GT2 family glycosyltransferase
VSAVTAQVQTSVLMVTWNSAEVLPASLDALRLARPSPAELVIVDNASTDRSVEMVESAAQGAPFDVNLIRSTVNLGFAAGMNRAIAAASSPYILLLNPDVRVVPDMIGQLHDAIERAPAEVYAVGPKLLRAAGNSLESTNVIDSVGIQMTRDGRHFDRGAAEWDAGQFDKPEEVFGLTGAAVIFRKATLEDCKVDGEIFDEDFFAYREDADLAWRMRGFGYRALYEPRAVGYHLRRVTPERRRSLPAAINRHSVKNRFLLRIHHADTGWMRAFGVRSLARDVLVIGACFTVERSSLPGLICLVRKLRPHWRRRQLILSGRRVSSSDLRSWFR